MATYYLDPSIASEGNGSGWGNGVAFKTLKHTFAAGDTILVAKSAEASVSILGVAGAYPAIIITTSDNLTGTIAQYDFIRLTSGGDLDNTIYMVKGINWSGGVFTITLYRPYRGTAESGKTIYKLTPATGASGDWTPTAGTGTAANPITLQCGINTSNNNQDGFTIIQGPGSGNGLGALTYWNISNLAFYYFSILYSGILTNCILTKLFAFRAATGWTNGNTWYSCTVNGFVTEQCSVNGPNFADCVVNDLETAHPTNQGFQPGTIRESLFYRWKNAGYASYNALYITFNIYRTAFMDCVFDELASGCTNIYLYASPIIVSDFILRNPTLGSGTVINNNTFDGYIQMQNVNGSATDHRTYYGHLTEGKTTELSYDASVYNTAAPSAKVTLGQSAYPFRVRHYIPCDAGVQKTVSVYFRKNSSYGSVTRPTMRVRWMTGSAGALVSNVDDEVMSDTNDSFVQVSKIVTPSVKGAIIVELLFQSANSGAIAWYDDLAWA